MPAKRAIQEAAVLSYLKKNGRITPIEAYNYLGIYRLAVFIHRLRRKEWDIVAVKERDEHGKQRATCIYILSPNQRKL